MMAQNEKPRPRTLCRAFFVFILCLLASPGQLWAQGDDEQLRNPILIISSYNPDASSISTTISNFISQYESLGGKSVVVTENMNCKSFSEAFEWKETMRTILAKYTDRKLPTLIILLGQEAWTSYLSQEDRIIKEVPVFCGMVSRNAVILPPSGTRLEDWEPESIDVFRDVRNVDILAGYVYHYDVAQNIKLILDFYPATRNIAFISDNSYGGVSMQALVKKEMARFPTLNLILLDGRKHSLYTISDQIATLPENTAILVGTWRNDKNDQYFMTNSAYTLMGAGKNIPTFTLASTGMGYWALGGYYPDYKNIGQSLGTQAYNLLYRGLRDSVSLKEFSNSYHFDAIKLKEFGFEKKILPPGSKIENKSKTFWEEYRYEIGIVIAAFVALLLGLCISLVMYIRARMLQSHLEKSEKELIVAKDRAEESNRLKTAFLANMSHEIRTPLNAIVGFSSVISTEQCGPDELAEYSKIIKLNSDLLLRLINDILDISRMESGRMQFNYGEQELVLLCQNVMATCSRNGREGVEYIFNAPVESFMLYTDAQRLQQVLINLLGNAGKFTQQGSITLDFEIDDRKVTFSVTDTGCGIPPEKQKQVFERFEKLDDMVQGTGLGLSICRLTLDKFGGEIWVDPNYTGGARFVFTHPLRRPESEE